MAQRGDETDEAWTLRRFQWAYKHAIGAMLVTSFTTVIAFLANASSVIAPIRLFGLWAALLVTVNFMLVCLWFPAVVALHHKVFSRCCSCCQAKSPGGQQRGGDSCKGGGGEPPV